MDLGLRLNIKVTDFGRSEVMSRLMFSGDRGLINGASCLIGRVKYLLDGVKW